MRAVPAIDATAMNSLKELHKKCKAKKIELVFSHVNHQPLDAMKKSGLYDEVGESHFRLHIDDAIEFASKKLCDR